MNNEELLSRVIDEVRLCKQTENFASRINADVLGKVPELCERFGLSKGKVFEIGIRLFLELKRRRQL